MAAKLSEGAFIRLFREVGPAAMARDLGTPQSMLMKRRRNIERKHGIVIAAPHSNASHAPFAAAAIPGRLHLAVQDGVVLIGSDLHAWPGEPGTGFKAFIKFIKEFNPKAVIMNGDVIDGASISRHPPLGWDRLPTLIEEIEAAQQLLHQIEVAVPRKAELFWPCGNHDARFSKELASKVPEYGRLHGTQLKDHFGPRWSPCWSVWINDDVVVKHRPKSGGVHASYTSTLHSGKTFIHGHLHSLKCTPLVDYNGRRWGVDCGTLAADIYGPQFSYIEDGVRNWSEGFVLATFVDGQLLQPELCVVQAPGVVEWRGRRIAV